MSDEVLYPVKLERAAALAWCDRRKHVEEPIFPGYVFCQFDPTLRTPILGTPGVVQILHGAHDTARRYG